MNSYGHKEGDDITTQETILALTDTERSISRLNKKRAYGALGLIATVAVGVVGGLLLHNKVPSELFVTGETLDALAILYLAGRENILGAVVSQKKETASDQRRFINGKRNGYYK